MCFNVFHTCNKSVIAPAPRLCYEDCHLFDKVHCKYEVEMARKHSSAFELLPDCTQLPKENKLCKPMRDFVFGKFVAFSFIISFFLILSPFPQVLGAWRVPLRGL